MVYTLLINKADRKTIPVIPVDRDSFKIWHSKQSSFVKNFLAGLGHEVKSGVYVIIPNSEGKISQILLSVENADDFWAFGCLPINLPAGTYQIVANWKKDQLQRAVLAWGLGAYRFSKYKKQKALVAKLLVPKGIDINYAENLIAANTLVRDLINTPAEDMTPQALGKAAQELAKSFGAKYTITSGKNLLNKGFRAIHAVGRASVNEPCLIDFSWGKEKAPKVTLVGKGVCFDSGGLDLKPADGMVVMKKDMAGAAHVLGLAKMIMAANLPVRLRVIIPAVENLVSSNSIKPGDVITTYNGTTVEITNTDAEGRLILADALALASEDKPELLIDFASLTGAARIAVGTEIAAFFTNDNKAANEVFAFAEQEDDPCCRLPLYKPYMSGQDSKIADLRNLDVSSSYGGAIKAALFLQKFVAKDLPWLHFDIMAFNTRYRHGRPEGGEAQGIRAVFCYLTKKFGGNK